MSDWAWPRTSFSYLECFLARLMCSYSYVFWRGTLEHAEPHLIVQQRKDHSETSKYTRPFPGFSCEPKNLWSAVWWNRKHMVSTWFLHIRCVYLTEPHIDRSLGIVFSPWQGVQVWSQQQFSSRTHPTFGQNLPLEWLICLGGFLVHGWKLGFQIAWVSLLWAGCKGTSHHPTILASVAATRDLISPTLLWNHHSLYP